MNTIEHTVADDPSPDAGLGRPHGAKETANTTDIEKSLPAAGKLFTLTWKNYLTESWSRR